MKITKIMGQITRWKSSYFYDRDCRLDYSIIYGWYCKDHKDGITKTYNCTIREAIKKISDSLKGD